MNTEELGTAREGEKISEKNAKGNKMRWKRKMGRIWRGRRGGGGGTST